MEKTGCEWLKCPDFKRTKDRPDGFCSDPIEYVRRDTGEPCCKRRSDAVCLAEGDCTLAKKVRELEDRIMKLEAKALLLV